MNDDYFLALLQKIKSGSGLLGGSARYDYVGFTHTAGNVTQMVFKMGGNGGTTVATLDLSYTAGEITGIMKS